MQKAKLQVSIEFLSYNQGLKTGKNRTSTVKKEMYSQKKIWAWVAWGVLVSQALRGILVSS